MQIVQTKISSGMSGKLNFNSKSPLECFNNRKEIACCQVRIKDF